MSGRVLGTESFVYVTSSLYRSSHYRKISKFNNIYKCLVADTLEKAHLNTDCARELSHDIGHLGLHYDSYVFTSKSCRIP